MVCVVSDCVWTISISWAFYYFLVKRIPRNFAMLGSVVLLATVMLPRFYERDNLTEFYGLLPTILSQVFLLHDYLTLRRLATLVSLGGAITTGAVLKHTNVATASVCTRLIAFVEFRNKGFPKAVKVTFLLSVPFILTTALSALYWESIGGLLDIWQETV